MAVTGRLPPASPCIGHCVMDRQAGLCTGCARTLDEIVRWGAADEAERARVWADLPARAARLRLTLRRLDWRGAELLDAVAQRLAGGWTLRAGPADAAAEIAGPVEETARSDSALTLRTATAILRLEAPHWLAAFEIAPAGSRPRLALALPQGRAGPATSAQADGRHVVAAPPLRAEVDAPSLGHHAAPLPKGWARIATLDPA
ncbi:DUF1289 domain-containing protein [Rhodovulum sp. 12E13]|uniref:DUF1289 domain-containing protein n=1 Tax=Rhodovulum sp. 12E13 TaxID=2203891 RepID=UPI0018F72CCC